MELARVLLQAAGPLERSTACSTQGPRPGRTRTHTYPSLTSGSANAVRRMLSPLMTHHASASAASAAPAWHWRRLGTLAPPLLLLLPLAPPALQAAALARMAAQDAVDPFELMAAAREGFLRSVRRSTARHGQGPGGAPVRARVCARARVRCFTARERDPLVALPALAGRTNAARAGLMLPAAIQGPLPRPTPFTAVRPPSPPVHLPPPPCPSRPAPAPPSPVPRSARTSAP